MKPPGALARFDQRLAVVAAAGFLARILIVLWIPTQPVSDFWEYFTRATSLAASDSYDVSPSRPDAAHPPGYPLLLAFAMLLMPGIDPLLTAKLANCLLGAATIWIGGRLAGEIGGDRAGFVAAILFAFYPRQLLMPCLLASENLFAPLLLLFALVTIRAGRTATALPDALAAGVLVGALSLTRTVAYGLGAVWAIASAAGRRKSGRIAAELLLLMLVQHALLLPWALRNRRELGTFTFLTSTGGIGLFIGNNDNATGDWYPWQPDLERHRPGVFAGSAVEVDRAAFDEAVEWIGANPGRAARLYLEKLRLIVVQDTLAADWAIFAESVSPPDPGVPVVPGPHPLKGHRRGALRFLRAAGALLASFAFGGAFLLLRAAVHDGRRPPGVAFAALFATALYLALISALIAVNGRYRWPLEDLAVPLAAVAIARIRPARPAIPDDTLMLHS